MEAIFLICGAGGPQLKRNPLGSGNNSMLRALLYGRLSSEATFIYKFLLPPVFGALWAFFTFKAFTDPASITFNGRPGAMPAGFEWVIAALGIGGLAFLLYVGAGLKTIRVHDDILYIGNYFRETTVPLAAVTQVHLHKYLRPTCITLTLATDTPLGNRVTFMPPISRGDAEARRLAELWQQLLDDENGSRVPAA